MSEQELIKAAVRHRADREDGSTKSASDSGMLLKGRIHRPTRGPAARPAPTKTPAEKLIADAERLEKEAATGMLAMRQANYTNARRLRHEARALELAASAAERTAQANHYRETAKSITGDPALVRDIERASEIEKGI